MNNLMMQVTRLDTALTESAGQVTLLGTQLLPSAACIDVLQRFKSVQAGRGSKFYGEPRENETLRKQCLALSSETDLQQMLQAQLVKLLAQLREKELSWQAYMVFVVEETEVGRRLYGFELPQKAMLTLGEQGELVLAQALDYDKPGLGFTIDLDALHQPVGVDYSITLSFGFGDKDLVESIKNWLGFIATQDAKEETQQFLQALASFRQDLPQEQAQAIEEKTLEFCLEQDKQGAPVAIAQLSQVMDEEQPTRFQSYMQERFPEQAEGFIPDRKSLKSFARYSGRSRDISISFNASSLGSYIEFNADNETLTLSSLPRSLLKQLKS